MLRQISLQKLTIQVWDSGGDLPTLLFFHGVLRNHQDFYPILAQFSRFYRCVAVDLRGHGASGRNPSQYRVQDYVNDMVEFTEMEFGHGVYLYGHSLGGMIAAAVAARLPHLVRGVIMEDPPFHTMGDRLRSSSLGGYFDGVLDAKLRSQSLQELTRNLSEVQMQDPTTGRTWKLSDVRDQVSIRFAARCLLDVDSDVLLPIVEGRWLEGYNVEETLSKISSPTLILQADGAAGGMLTDEDASFIQSVVPETFLYRMQHIGHLMHWGATEKTVNTSLAFLQSLMSN